MVSRGLVRALGALLVALLFVGTEASAVMAASPGCSVEAAPRAASAGTTFVISGTGFKPTSMTLHKGATDAGTRTIDIGTADPWQISVRSRPGDEGSWTAELSSDECTAVAEFRVTLANTDVVSDALSGGSQPVPLAVAIMVLAAGLGGGVFLGRRFRAGPIDNRAW